MPGCCSQGDATAPQKHPKTPISVPPAPGMGASRAQQDSLWVTKGCVALALPKVLVAVQRYCPPSCGLTPRISRRRAFREAVMASRWLGATCEPLVATRLPSRYSARVAGGRLSTEQCTTASPPPCGSCSSVREGVLGGSAAQGGGSEVVPDPGEPPASWPYLGGRAHVVATRHSCAWELLSP